MQNVQKDRKTQSKINKHTNRKQPSKKERTQKKNRWVVHTENNFKKENKEVKMRFSPKRNFCFEKRILTNGKISQEMTNQDTKR